MNLNDAIIKNFNIGDIFVSHNALPVLILPTGYGTNKYYLAGSSGFLPWSNESNSDKEAILNYLNKHEFVLSRNIDEEIKKSLQFCHKQLGNKPIEKPEIDKIFVADNKRPNGFFILRDNDKIKEGDFVIHGANLVDKISAIENYSLVSNSKGKKVADAKAEWNHLNNLQFVRKFVNINFPENFIQLNPDDTIKKGDLFEFSDTFSNNWTDPKLILGKKYSEVFKYSPQLIVARKAD